MRGGNQIANRSNNQMPYANTRTKRRRLEVQGDRVSSNERRGDWRIKTEVVGLAGSQSGGGARPGGDGEGRCIVSGH